MAPAKKTKAPVGKKVVDPKNKTVAFGNWNILDPDDLTVVQLRGNKGFALRENEHTSKGEQSLIDLARANGGTAEVLMRMTINVVDEIAEKFDVSGIKLAPKR